MDPIIALILSIAGVVILLCFAIIGFFLTRVISDVRSNTSGIGRNKGTIELVKQQQENDIKRMEENTQIVITQLGKDVQDLTTSLNVHSENVNKLIQTIIEKQ